MLGNADDVKVYTESDEEEGYVLSLLLVFVLEKLLDRKVVSVNFKDLFINVLVQQCKLGSIPEELV